jgi:putative transposase
VSAFIDAHRDRFGVEPICRTLGVSASAYFYRTTGRRSARQLAGERLLAVICQTHTDKFEAYGYRKMWKALVRNGETAPRCQVQRLMRADGLRGAERRGRPWRTTIPDPNAEQRPDPGRPCSLLRLRTGCGGRFHVSALLGGQGLHQLHHRRA